MLAHAFSVLSLMNIHKGGGFTNLLSKIFTHTRNNYDDVVTDVTGLVATLVGRGLGL